MNLLPTTFVEVETEHVIEKLAFDAIFTLLHKHNNTRNMKPEHHHTMIVATFEPHRRHHQTRAHDYQASQLQCIHSEAMVLTLTDRQEATPTRYH